MTAGDGTVACSDLPQLSARTSVAVDETWNITRDTTVSRWDVTMPSPRLWCLQFDSEASGLGIFEVILLAPSEWPDSLTAPLPSCSNLPQTDPKDHWLLQAQTTSELLRPIPSLTPTLCSTTSEHLRRMSSLKPKFCSKPTL